MTTTLEELLSKTEPKPETIDVAEPAADSPNSNQGNSRKRSALSFLLSEDPMDKFNKLFDFEDDDNSNGVAPKKERSSSPLEEEDLALYDPVTHLQNIMARESAICLKTRILQNKNANDYKKRLHPQAMYHMIVKCVLERADVLINKNASRTPQANHLRWKAWEEIKKILVEKTGQNISIEQIQTIWRHQKAKLARTIDFSKRVDASMYSDEPDYVNTGEYALNFSNQSFRQANSQSPTPSHQLSLAELLSRQPTLNMSLPHDEHLLTAKTTQMGGTSSGESNDSSFPAIAKTEPQSPQGRSPNQNSFINGNSGRKNTSISDETHLALQKLIQVFLAIYLKI
ncbi:hypothetical protein WR25_01313 isoform F [Diploscapter pachys]|uniref:Regulatory protein zeste n=1 Tax=Diploscapter pachys TaxID=2018661 RepID=A0A2A2KPZ4_9BILA|nr:hypothetical protein WR25_01313 isoform F [Diploscapter pachys]